MVSVHKDFICYLQELCGILPSEAFQLLEVSLDVCTGSSHKGSVNHPLILGYLRVEWGICPGHVTQSFIEISGSLIWFLDIIVILDILVDFLTPTHSPCRRGSRLVTQGFLSFSGIETPVRSRLWHCFLCPSFYN